MQVKFHWVQYKNLLSYGNVFTKVDLESFRTTIQKGSVGSGKSTLLDAICYALYGSPYRKIKLGQMINSINKKSLMVEIQFSIGLDVYLVKRGMKPNIFEIYKNQEIIIEDAALKDYQTVLESIIGINFKTFKQIVVIGSANYVPFMSLPAAERRLITEQVLDISVFSSMLEICKQKHNETKSAIDNVTYELGTLTNQLTSQNHMLTSLEKDQAIRLQDIEFKKSELVTEITNIQRQQKDLNEIIETTKPAKESLDKLKEAKTKLERMIFKNNIKKKDLETSTGFYDHDSCPTCNQTIPLALKEQKNQEVFDQVHVLTEEISKAEGYLDGFGFKIAALESQVDQFDDATNKLYSSNQILKRAKREYEAMENLRDNSDTIDLCKIKISDLLSLSSQKKDDKNVLNEDLIYYKSSLEILKDTGIKAKIIATFIPKLNVLINQYLQKFDLFIQFELDELFQETIKSRNRDVFSYNSFSEGERKKIDLAILFSWRKIAESRNSISTNLLIFDETMDSSLDIESVDTFIEILESIEENVNIIVISHREVVPELFERHLTVKKVKDFSVLEEICGTMTTT